MHRKGPVIISTEKLQVIEKFLVSITFVAQPKAKRVPSLEVPAVPVGLLEICAI